jgi:hypothetical protein
MNPGGRILPGLHDSIDAILKENTVVGYSLALVRLEAEVEVEYGAWGISTEDGEKMTPEVWSIYLCFWCEY